MTHPPLAQPAPAPDSAALVGHPDLVLVVSDLHLGDGQDPVTGRYSKRENFFADRAFSAFLEHHDPRSSSDTALLVINGDAFDFLRGLRGLRDAGRGVCPPGGAGGARSSGRQDEGDRQYYSTSSRTHVWST